MRSYNGFSAILDDRAARMSDEQLTEALDAELAGLGALERINFDNVAKTLQSSAQTALPGAAQGAAMGAAAGPWGALIGALAGGASTLAASGGKRPVPPTHVQPTIPTAPPPTAAVTAEPPTQVFSPGDPAKPNAPSNAAAQLLWVMQNPQMMQALASLVAGTVGRRQIPVGQTTAPPGAFLNLLTTLASQASMQADAIAEGVEDSYLRSDDGGYNVDVGSPDARADALLAQLRSASTRNSSPRRSSALEWLATSGIGRTTNIQILE